jgi:hypothetical protein
MLFRFLCSDGDRDESLSWCGLCDGVEGIDLECCRVEGEMFSGKEFAGIGDAASVCPSKVWDWSAAGMVVVIEAGSIIPSLNSRNVIRLGR